MRVLLVEDSATVAAYVLGVLRDHPDIECLPVARDAGSGVRCAKEHAPDVVLMDVKLPDHDGVWAIQEIMADSPCPIVVLSGHLSSRERDITFEALQAGAVDVLAKPTSLEPEARAGFGATLVSTVRLMVTAKVVRRSRPRRVSEGPPVEILDMPAHLLACRRYLLIGASTGGPPLLYGLLAKLRRPFPLPILISQHTLSGFDSTLADWLSQTGHRVRVARERDIPRPGEVIVAPADGELRVDRDRMRLADRTPDTSVCSIDALFESAARHWGAGCVALLLSGMGEDGVDGLESLKAHGALTIAQRPDSCVVPSMPESAINRGAAHYALSPKQLTRLVRALGLASGSEHIAFERHD